MVGGQRGRTVYFAEGQAPQMKRITLEIHADVDEYTIEYEIDELKKSIKEVLNKHFSVNCEIYLTGQVPIHEVED